MTDIIRVLLADDHPIVRAGLRAALELAPDTLLVGESADANHIRHMCLERLPDVLLLDLHMPGPPPAATVADLRACCPLLKILILTADDDGMFVRGMLAAGVAGYVLKDEDTETILHAIRTVVQGGAWFSRSIVAKLGQIPGGDTSPPGIRLLSPREIAILQLVVAGKTNREIGTVLGISEKTVEKRIGELFAKLGVMTRVEAAVRAVREGLV